MRVLVDFLLQEHSLALDYHLRAYIYYYFHAIPIHFPHG